MKHNPIRCTTAEMSVLLGIAPRTLRDMVARGCPKNGRDEFIPSDVLRWLTRPENAPGDEVSKIKADLIRAQREQIELKAQALREDLIDRGKATEAFEFIRENSVAAILKESARIINPDIRSEYEAVAADIAAQRPDWDKKTDVDPTTH